MKGCDRLADVERRRFLSGAGVAAAGGAAASVLPATPAKAQAPTARVSYPSTRLANVSDLEPDVPFDIAYPNDGAPGVLLKLGKPVEQ